MSESGFFVTPGDRHPVSGSHFLVHLFHYGDWDLRFFPVGWDFQIAEIDWRFFSWLSLCATDFFMRYLYSFQGLSSPVLACFAGCVLLLSVVSAWMRTAFLAGGNAVVRSGFDR